MSKTVKTIRGGTARAIGVTAGVFTLVPGVIILLVVGSVSGSPLFPASVERVIESTVPVVGVISDGTLPLFVVAFAALFGGLFTIGGVRLIATALLKSDYSVDIGVGGPGGGSGGE